MNRDYASTSVLGSEGRSGLLPYVPIAGALLAWGIVSVSGWGTPLLIPTPLRVLQAAYDVGWTFVPHCLATLLRICVGFFVAAIGGVTVGTIMQYNATIFRLLDGLVQTARPVPPVAVLPFMILVFGFSETGRLVVVVLGSGLLLTVTTIEAIKRVPMGVIRWGIVCGLVRRDLFMKVILPAAWPDMRGGFRVALALAISLVVVSEFMGARHGLGYLISVSKITLTTPTLLFTIVVLGWLGWGLDRALTCAFDRTTGWDRRAERAVVRSGKSNEN